MKKSLLWISYILYFAAAAVFFLYLLFPGETVRVALQASACQWFPQVGVEVGEMRPSLFPPGIVIESAVVSRKEGGRNGEVLIALETLRVSPRFLSWFSERGTVFDLRANSRGGTIAGAVTQPPPGGAGGGALEASFNGLRLQKFPALAKFFPENTAAALKGRLSIRFEKRWKVDVALEITDARVELTNPIIGREVLEFPQGKASAGIDGDLVRIAGFDMKGKQADVFLSGRIYLEGPGPEARVDVTGHVDPRQGFYDRMAEKVPKGFLPARKAGSRGFPFKIEGTVDRPLFFWD